MTAKEIDTEAEIMRLFKDFNYYLEEKFDGTRGIMQFFDSSVNPVLTTDTSKSADGYTRVFSRRVSKKTDWFCENTDALPHLRSISAPELHGTVIDGEMFIDGRPFSDVSSTLNCGWEKAVARQEEMGNITFHAFDITYYMGVCIECLPLTQRKRYLQKVINKINCPNVVMVEYIDHDDIEVKLHGNQYLKLLTQKEMYPTLWACVSKQMPLCTQGLTSEMWARYKLTRKAYYEYIVLIGGEGVILKYKKGKYFHKRGNEYLKVKKFLTREVLIIGYTSPTKEYNGKFPNDAWSYWVDSDDVRFPETDAEETSAKEMLEDGYTPVSKFYYYDQIGTVMYGVIVDEEYIKSLPKNKDFQIALQGFFSNSEKHKVVCVGECSGFTEEERKYISDNREACLGAVIEVKANEVFRDTGKMRHPRFLRFRKDKAQEECTWKDHIGA